MSTHDPLAPASRLTCDVCGGARGRSERHHLVWDAEPGTELVLAELCRRCAEQPGRLLELYGGRGLGSLRVTDAPIVRDAEPSHATRGMILRGFVYVLVALAAFVVVTIVTSR